MRNSIPLSWLMPLIVPLLMVVPVAAEQPSEAAPRCVVPPRTADTRPDREGVPTRVLLGVYVIDIAGITDVEQTFNARFALRAQWKDPRLAALGHCKFRVNDVWNPQLRFVNDRNLVKLREDIVEIDADGTVTYTQGFVGDLTVPIELKEFPFDSHVLPFMIIAVEYEPDEVSFVVNEELTARSERFSIADWSIGPGKAQVDSFYFAPQNRNFAQFNYAFRASRRTGFYIWKVVFPLMIFIFMSWTVFWLDPTHLGTQVGVAATTMVILVVFQLNLGTVLPKVPYLTRVDFFVLGSQILVFLALVEAVSTGTLAGMGKGALAKKLDWWSRFIFPASFFVVLLFAFFV